MTTDFAGEKVGCPAHFMSFSGRCYLFAPGTTTWLTARDYCRERGANLISIYLNMTSSFNREMNSLKASYTGNFWTGGFYSHAAGEFEWVDGSPFSYSFWYPGQSSETFNHSTNYYIAVGNPAYSSTFYKEAPLWVESPGNYTFGVICKQTG